MDICLTATKSEPFIFSVVTFTLANVADFYIFMVLYDCWLHSFVTKSYKSRILNAICKSWVTAHLGKLLTVWRNLFCRRCNFKR